MHDAEQTLEGTVQHIDNILLSVEQTAGNVYWDLVANLDQPDRMEDYCRRVMECNPYIVGCAIVFKPYFYPNRELFMAYVYRKGNSVMTDENTELATKESFAYRPYTEQVWYTEPMETGQACWTDPLKDDETEGEAITSFCLPIFDRDMNRVGVLSIDLSIGLLSQIVLAAKPSVNGYSVLLGRKGSFIVHPDKEKLEHQTVFTQFENSDNPTAREAAEAMVAGETGHKLFRLKDRDWYVFYKPFVRTAVPGRTTEQLSWSVGVVYPEDDIFGDYNRLFYMVLAIAIIGLLIFLALCRFITHRQLLPLAFLTRSAQRIADGHYDETIPATKREDEIGQLQAHFQQMQESLVMQIGKSEQMSAALQEQGEVLHQAYTQAQEADRVKIAFLHYMTNQMTGPSEAISKSVDKLCDHYDEYDQEATDHEVRIIQQQSQVIIDLISHLMRVAENETGEEGAYE